MRIAFFLSLLIHLFFFSSIYLKKNNRRILLPVPLPIPVSFYHPTIKNPSRMRLKPKFATLKRPPSLPSIPSEKKKIILAAPMVFVPPLSPEGHLPEAGSLPAWEEFRPSPAYPEFARNRGWEGDVFLDIETDGQGRVIKIELKKSSGFRILDAAAERSVQRWRLNPFFKARVPIVFKLSG